MTGSSNTYSVLSPTGILGYGFPLASFRRGLEKGPDLVAVDAGSSDPGPHYLGAGTSFTSRSAVKRDLDIILPAVVEAGIPFIVGSAGGAGAKPHVDWTMDILNEVVLERKLAFSLAVIYADISRSDVLRALEEGQIQPLGPAGELTKKDVSESVRIVGQMGIGPVAEALRHGSQVVICGRCYDPSVFAAPAILRGFPAGLAYHMGKILECAAIAATPGSGCDCVMGTLHEDAFVLESMNPERTFTRTSTAAHTLYEKSDPYRLPGPDGEIDLHDTVFEEIGGGHVRVSGTRYSSAAPTVKLEGVRSAGFRTTCIAGVRDPVLIGQIDSALGSVRELAEDRFSLRHGEDHLHFHIYGRNAVMGDLEPQRAEPSHELGIVIDAIAPEQERAHALCGFVRSTLLHYGYPGRISTAGNLALLYSPSDIDCGETYAFNMNHLMTGEDPDSLFPIEYAEVAP